MTYLVGASGDGLHLAVELGLEAVLGFAELSGDLVRVAFVGGLIRALDEHAGDCPKPTTVIRKS